ncbi:unnamed protein product, partial [Chrysoparadoxa australica]
MDPDSQKLNTDVQLSHQKHVGTCLAYRIFATKQLHSRYRMLRSFLLQLQLINAARDKQRQKLCGGPQEAARRLSVLAASAMYDGARRRCSQWLAERNERQLLEDEERNAMKKKKRAMAQRQQHTVNEHQHQHQPAEDEGEDANTRSADEDDESD